MRKLFRLCAAGYLVVLFPLADCRASGRGASASASAGAGASKNVNLELAPDDSTRNEVGLNVWFLNDWDGSQAFVDVMKHSRRWLDEAAKTPATVDALGWPTQDGATVIFADTDSSLVNGTYRFVAKGKTDPQVQWVAATVSNRRYDSGTNTTTADITLKLAPGKATALLVLHNTKRSRADVAGSGVTDVRLYRPGYAKDGSEVFTTQFVRALRKVSVIRTMDWTATNKNTVVHWSERATPTQASQAAGIGPKFTVKNPGGSYDITDGVTGVAIEHQVQLANAVGADLWINVPAAADDGYVRNLALAILYGTDGINPYPSAQATPAYPPLDSRLNVYVEYANEIWNGARDFYCMPMIRTLVAGADTSHPIRSDGKTPTGNEWELVWRYPAWRLAEVSKIFRSVHGDGAMGKRVRPVLMTQLGNGQGTLEVALKWAHKYYGAQSPAIALGQLYFAAGGSAYYGVNTWSANPDSFFASGNYPQRGFGKQVAVDTMWAMNWGLRHVAYEGGLSLDNGVFGNDSEHVVVNADSRMQGVVEFAHNIWSANGGDLLVYYVLRGPPSWEFTPSIGKLDTPKLRALDALASSKRAAVTLGSILPGTITAAQFYPDGRIRSNSDYTDKVDGETVVRSGDTTPGEWMAVVARAPAAFAGTLTVRGVSSGGKIRVWVNGVTKGNVTFGDAGRRLQDSSGLALDIPKGVAVLRFETVSGSFGMAGVTVTRL